MPVIFKSKYDFIHLGLIDQLNQLRWSFIHQRGTSSVQSSFKKYVQIYSLSVRMGGSSVVNSIHQTIYNVSSTRVISDAYRRRTGPWSLGSSRSRVPLGGGRYTAAGYSKRLLQTRKQEQSIKTSAFSSCFQTFVTAFQANPIGMMTSVATLLGSCALVALLVAAIPALFALRRTLVAAEVLLVSLQDELPDAVAALRLSGLELSDAIEEVSGLGSDMTAGLRATARALVGAEGGMRGSVEALQAMTPAMHQFAEKALQKRASLATRPRGLGDSLEQVRKGVRRTTGVSKAARLALNAARLIDSTI